MEKYKGKYRIASSRCQTWDYGWDAAYFITINTKNRIHYFGKIVDEEMYLSQVGVIANDCWREIINHAKNIKLGSFVVMPNHIHGILILDGNNRFVRNFGNVGENDIDNVGENDIVIVETRHALSLRQYDPNDANVSNVSNAAKNPNDANDSKNQNRKNDQMKQSPSSTQPLITPGKQRFRNQGRNTISSIVGSYKSAVSKEVHRLGYNFAWQSRFHDHIIRDEAEYLRISNYIESNICNWAKKNPCNTGPISKRKK